MNWIRTFLAVVTLAAAATGYAQTTDPVGTVGGSVAPQIADAIRILRIAVGLEAAPPSSPFGDMNGDGRITAADALVALRLAVGLPVRLDQGGGTGPATPPTPPELMPQMMVETSRFGYSDGDPITFQLALRNRSWSEGLTYTWHFPGGHEYNITIINSAGEKVWVGHNGNDAAAIITSITLKPGEEKTWTLVWDQKDANGVQVPDGYYTAVAELVPAKSEDTVTPMTGKTQFGIGPRYQEPPADYLPLWLGQQSDYDSMRKGWEGRTITFVDTTTIDGKQYTVASGLPEATGNALLRRVDDDLVVQRVGDKDEERYHLKAPVGTTWTFSNGATVKATMASRTDVLETPLQTFERCLRIDFFVGPDYAWTEWLAPEVGVVGWDFNGIAGPVPFRIRTYNRPLVPSPVPDTNPTGSLPSIVLEPSFVAVAPGSTVQFHAKVLDANGGNPGVPVQWGCEEQIGTISQDGVLTVTGPAGVSGTVKAYAEVGGKGYVAYAKVLIEGIVPPPSSRLALVEGGSLRVEPGPAGSGVLIATIRCFGPSSSWVGDRVDIQQKGEVWYIEPYVRQDPPGAVDLPVLTSWETQVKIPSSASSGQVTVTLLGADGSITVTAAAPG